MLRESEVHKFNNGTLARILEKLDHMVKDFMLSKFNPSMENRIWSEDDKKRSKEFIEVIERRLKIRRIFRSLESFVSGRIKRWRYNLIPAESKFKTPCSIIKDKYMMKAQVHVLKSSAISDVMRVDILEFDWDILNPGRFIDWLVVVEEVFEFKEVPSNYHVEELMSVYDTDIEDVIEEEEVFIWNVGLGGKDDNIKDVLVAANDLCSLMIQTTLSVDFEEDINTKYMKPDPFFNIWSSVSHCCGMTLESRVPVLAPMPPLAWTVLARVELASAIIFWCDGLEMKVHLFVECCVYKDIWEYSSSSMEPEVIQIDALPVSGDRTTRSVSKLKRKGKQNEVPFHEIINLDMDEDRKDLVFIDGKAESNKKMKGVVGVSLGSGNSSKSDSKKDVHVVPAHFPKGFTSGSNDCSALQAHFDNKDLPSLCYLI
nr:ubiquitin-conjugating enzyme family protein [Tanacetum cinerariifolium]